MTSPLPRLGLHYVALAKGVGSPSRNSQAFHSLNRVRLPAVLAHNEYLGVCRSNADSIGRALCDVERDLGVGNLHRQYYYW